MAGNSYGRSPRELYGISVASELSGVGKQALRAYESKGLLTPARTEGGTRRYSDQDLDRIRRISELLESGVNLAGIARILPLEVDNAGLRSHACQLESDNAQLERANARLRKGNRGTHH